MPDPKAEGKERTILQNETHYSKDYVGRRQKKYRGQIWKIGFKRAKYLGGRSSGKLYPSGNPAKGVKPTVSAKFNY